MSLPKSAAGQRAIARLASDLLDILVIGGGIVGAGVARDAALRGFNVGLIDRHDFAFGTSSRSSRLLHGGIRYLAQGRLGLVRKASIEKTILRRIAPHLAEPLEFLFPAYRASGWPLWQLRIGVKVYDWLCRDGNLGRSGAVDARNLLELAPGLNADNLTGGVRYFDAFTNDARLVIDTLRSAERAGAAMGNYARLISVESRAGEFLCQVADELQQRPFSIRTHTVVNASGPWAQGLGLSGVQLRLTKGIHLVFEHQRIPVAKAIVITEGSRLLFVIPWGERVIVGTTDTDYSGDIERVRSEPSDVDYLLSTLAKHFPTLDVEPGQIVSSWAGLRPLVADRHGRPSDISRSHRIQQTCAGWWDVTGGKLTTYRLMAEETVDQIARRLGRTARCRTADEPLLPPGDAVRFSGILPPTVHRDVVEHACLQEWASHLDDVMMRRTGWHYYHRNAEAMARQVAGWMAEVRGWDAAKISQELQRYRAESDGPIFGRGTLGPDGER